MGHFQHQRAICQYIHAKGSICYSKDPNGLMDFTRGKVLGKDGEEGWPGLWKLIISHIGLAFTLTKHITSIIQ